MTIDDAITLIADAVPRKFMNLHRRYCLRCGDELVPYKGETGAYLIYCPYCDTRTIVRAGDTHEALDIVGMEEKGEPETFFPNKKNFKAMQKDFKTLSDKLVNTREMLKVMAEILE